MEVYTIKEIAQMLSVNEETVRRWIRDEKLEAQRGVGRQGSRVSSECLKRFLNQNTNLITSAAITTLGLTTIGVGAALATFTGLPLIAGGLLASIIGSNKPEDSSKVSNQQKKVELMEKKYELEMRKAEVSVEICRLENEVNLLNSQVEAINEVIKTL